MFTFVLQVAICTTLLASSIAAQSTTRATFDNVRRFLFDDQGNQVDAYGAKVNYFAGKYYLYGNSWDGEIVPCPVKSYSSLDLISWHYEGCLFDVGALTATDQINTSGFSRPHIVYNPTSKLYVLWGNGGTPGYSVATSKSPAGPFTISSGRGLIDPAFDSLQPADVGAESYGNDGYLVYSVLNFADPRAGSIWPQIYQTMHISKLTPDFLNTTQVSYNVTSAAYDLVDNQPESPDFFIRNGTYYVATSNSCAWCNGTIALIYRSSSIEGPWTRQIISGYGCNTQFEGILTLPGTSTLVWHGTSVPGGPRIGWSGHVFQPLKFNADGSVQDLDCSVSAKYTIDVPKGNGTAATPAPVTDSSPALAAYYPVCDISSYKIFQTWVSSKSGSLKTVTVNIAAGAQTTNLTMQVFAFSSIKDLLAPGYKYTTLATQVFTRSQLLETFNNATAALTNATVKAGDHLGIAISANGFGALSIATQPDLASYCYLEYGNEKQLDDQANGIYWAQRDTHAGSNQVLIVQGAGQTSPRGPTGMQGGPYERVGKGIKFSTYVE